MVYVTFIEEIQVAGSNGQRAKIYGLFTQMYPNIWLSVQMETCDKSDTKYAADIFSIRAAYERISPYIHKTPIFTSETLNGFAGRRIFLKCECLQKG